jgi:hypothetical protein
MGGTDRISDATTDTGSPWGLQVSVVVQKQSGIEGPKPDLLRLKGGGLQRSLGKVGILTAHSS